MKFNQELLFFFLPITTILTIDNTKIIVKHSIGSMKATIIAIIKDIIFDNYYHI